MVYLSVLLNVFGIYLVKLKINNYTTLSLDSINKVFIYFLQLILEPWVVIGGILVFLAPFPLVVALQRLEISVVYPVSVGLTFLMLIPLSLYALGESLLWYKYIALALIVGGIYLLQKS